MQSQSSQRKVFVAIVAVFMLIAAGAIILLGGSSKKEGNAGDSGQYVDKLSHQTVSNPPGKAPDTYGSPSNSPIVLGINKFLDYGLDVDQIDNLNTAFYSYTQTLNRKISTISIDVDGIQSRHDPTIADSPFELLFKIQLDQKDNYQAKVQYQGVTDVRLFVIDSATSRVLFDSQVLYSSTPGGE